RHAPGGEPPVLKGMVLAWVLVSAWALVQGIVFQLRAPEKAFASMVTWFAPIPVVYVVLHRLTSADLGILPERFVGGPTALSLLNGLALLILLFLTRVLFYFHHARFVQ